MSTNSSPPTPSEVVTPELKKFLQTVSRLLNSAAQHIPVTHSLFKGQIVQAEREARDLVEAATSLPDTPTIQRNEAVAEAVRMLREVQHVAQGEGIQMRYDAIALLESFALEAAPSSAPTDNDFPFTVSQRAVVVASVAECMVAGANASGLVGNIESAVRSFWVRPSSAPPTHWRENPRVIDAWNAMVQILGPLGVPKTDGGKTPPAIVALDELRCAVAEAIRKDSTALPYCGECGASFPMPHEPHCSTLQRSAPQEPVAWLMRWHDTHTGARRSELFFRKEDATAYAPKSLTDPWVCELSPLYLVAPPAPTEPHPDDAAIISRIRRMVETNEHSFSAFESVAILRVCELAALPSSSTEQSHDAVESLAQLLADQVSDMAANFSWAMSNELGRDEWRGLARTILESRAAPLPASPTPELNPDTARLEHVEAWLDYFQWVEVGDLAGRHVRMDWFAGDGGGHWFTQARTFREAIDQSLHGSGAEAHQLPPTITAPKSAPASPTAPPNVREAMIAADLKAPLCAKCEADDIYERSPESCAECAANRIDAILSLPASAEQPK